MHGSVWAEAGSSSASFSWFSAHIGPGSNQQNLAKSGSYIGSDQLNILLLYIIGGMRPRV